MFTDICVIKENDEKYFFLTSIFNNIVQYNIITSIFSYSMAYFIKSLHCQFVYSLMSRNEDIRDSD